MQTERHYTYETASREFFGGVVTVRQLKRAANLPHSHPGRLRGLRINRNVVKFPESELAAWRKKILR